MDVLSKDQRHKNMAAIHSANTKPEMIVRKYLFWTRKITHNIERDKRVQQELARMGWHCMTIWECELKPKKREQTLLALEYTLNHIYLKDHTVSYSFDEEEKPLMAAEESEDTYHTLKK